MSSVILSQYSREWPETFAREHDLLVRAFEPVAVRVEHIGSTAVAGLVAKPVIDILLGAASLAAIESRIGQLDTIGYEYVTKYERELPSRRYFVKSAMSSYRVHLHRGLLSLAQGRAKRLTGHSRPRSGVFQQGRRQP